MASIIDCGTLACGFSLQQSQQTVSNERLRSIITVGYSPLTSKICI